MTLVNTRRAGWFALLALVCLLGAQVAEAVHHHTLDNNVVLCQLCSSPVGTAIAALAVALPPVVVATLKYTKLEPSALRPSYAFFPARGPPALP